MHVLVTLSFYTSRAYLIELVLLYLQLSAVHNCIFHCNDYPDCLVYSPCKTFITGLYFSAESKATPGKHQAQSYTAIEERYQSPTKVIYPVPDTIH